MDRSSLNYLVAIVVACGLLSQSCKSGSYVATGYPVSKRARGDHAQASGRAPSSDTLASLHTDACVNDALASVSLADPVASVMPTLAAISISGSSTTRVEVVTTPQASVRPFTAFSSSTPCVRAGALGSLRGSLTQQVLSQVQGWFAGPTMQLDGDAEERATYRIPSGYRCKGYRLRAGSVIQHARLTIYYVAADDEGAYRKLESAQNAHAAATSLDARVGQVVPLGTLEDGAGHSHTNYHEDYDLHCAEYVGLVLYGSAMEGGLLRKKSKIDIQVEILLEKMTKGSSVHDDEQVPIPVFGAQEWAQYFGEVGGEPSLPADIDEILNSPCPFWPGKTVKDTHLLVLMPSTVDGKAFTLDLLEELAKNPSENGHSTQYFLYDDEVQRSSGDAYPSSSYWILLTRDVLPGSRSKPYTAQQALVATQTAHIDHTPYKIPHVLEAATAILSHYVRSGHRLYKGTSDALSSIATSTRCAEFLEDTARHPSPVTLGRFCSRGLVFLSGFDDDAEFGVSCLRQFGTRNYRPSALLHSFGAEEWCRYFGEVEAPPPLPAHIVDTLNSACPFWPGKAVKDTHLLVLIPATVSGEPFSFNLLGELIQRPRGGGYPTKYDDYNDTVHKQFGARSLGHSYWVLLTRDVLEGSRNKDYASQKALVAAHATRTGLLYELPDALEAAAAILSHYTRSGERLYTDDPWTYTRCQALVNGRYPVVVGGFSFGGLDVGFDLGSVGFSGSRGVASLRKF